MTAPGPEVWVLLPLALAAGLDLYLTLLILGTASHLAWDASVPGILSGLESAPVLILAAVFYMLEVVAERFPPAALFWNSGHVVVRPVTAALLALLLLHGEPVEWQVLGAVVTGVVALGAHAVRVGGAFILWLSEARTSTQVLASAAEDVTVLALCVLVLDRPEAGTLLGALMVLVTVPMARHYLDGFVFGLRAAWGRTWGVLRSRRWLDRDAFPGWVTRLLEDDSAIPGGPLRGSRSAAFRLSATGVFRRGWLVITGSGPVFVYRSGLRMRPTVVPLTSIRPVELAEGAFHRRLVFVDPNGRAGQLHVPFDGPSAEGLRAEFDL